MKFSVINLAKSQSKPIKNQHLPLSAKCTGEKSPWSAENQLKLSGLCLNITIAICDLVWQNCMVLLPMSAALISLAQRCMNKLSNFTYTTIQWFDCFLEAHWWPVQAVCTVSLLWPSYLEDGCESCGVE